MTSTSALPPSTGFSLDNSTHQYGDSSNLERRNQSCIYEAPVPNISRTDEDDIGRGVFAQHEKGNLDGSDAASVDSTFTESTDVPRNLGTIDVACLIINQMVGTGIFVTPGLVLSMTGSKPISLALWAMGGVWAFLCAIIYLEFGTALPFTGGALIYLGEAFPRPQLLSTILVSIFFIVFLTTGNNCVVFAQYVLQLANPEEAESDFDGRLIIFIAITTLSLTFALFKVSILLAIFIAGLCAKGKPGSGLSHFTAQQPNMKSIDALGAMIYIIFSYQGWENANYVAGEIKAPRNTLRLGMTIGISTVTVLYILVNLAYFIALDYETIINSDGGLGIAARFAQTSFGHTTGIKIAVALSALGNVIAVTYTTSKVKRAIALQGFIPFYKFFSKIDNQFGTPGGAFILHWIFSVVLISWTPNKSPDFAFALGIFNYGNLIIMFLVGMGLFKLRRRMRTVNPKWKPLFFTNRISEILVAFLFCSMNIVMLVNIALPKEEGEVPSYWFPIVTACAIAIGLLYWSLLQMLQFRLGDSPTVGKLIGVEVTVYNGENDEEVPDSMRGLLKEASQDGSRHRLEWKVSDPLDSIVKRYHKCVELLLRYIW